MGPDGALYVADWTNPIINHGEVDFRDPRRDKQHGRIWRIAPKDSKAIDWKPVAGLPVAALLNKLLSPNRWDFEQARRELAKSPLADLQKALATWVKDDVTRRHAAWLLSGRSSDTTHLKAMLDPKNPNDTSVQVALRELGKASGYSGSTDLSAIAPWIEAKRNPRVRLEAFRALARIRTFESADLVLRNLPTDSNDSYLDFAAWTSLNELARLWLEEIATHPEKITDRAAQLYAITDIAAPSVTAPYVQRLFAGRTIDASGSGPWIELIGKAGGAAELTTLYSTFTKEGALQPDARIRVAKALADAAQTRNIRPQGDLNAIAPLLKSTDQTLLFAGIRLAGLWRQVQFVPQLAEYAGSEKDAALRNEALKALRLIGQQPSIDALRKLVAEDRPIAVRRAALVPYSALAAPEAIKSLASILKQPVDQAEATTLWRELFQNGAFAALFAKEIPKDLTPDAYAAALQAARGMGRNGKPLVALLTPLAGAKVAQRDYATEIASLVKAVKAGADPVAGELVYRRAGCIACHAIGGVGGNFGPDFSSLGASAPLDYIIESSINPAAKVKEGYHGFAFSMKDGSIMNGIPVRETATEVIIRPAPGMELPLIKANIIKKENIGSLMPPGFVDVLDNKSKLNLFAFLSQIGRPGPFDASKANVARIWTFNTSPPDGPAAKDSAVSISTLINGQLRQEEIPDKPYASVRFTASTPTKQPLILTGAKSAWLDGKPLPLTNGRSESTIPAGPHTLSIAPDKSAPHLKAQCDDVTFLDVK
ncbi:MAG: hypothetical protein K8R87_07435, partial [Verrucomicrobia bacterium]|nr:hypothetical protein [Verrucomicrobiota bacterium]